MKTNEPKMSLVTKFRLSNNWQLALKDHGFKSRTTSALSPSLMADDSERQKSEIEKL